MAKVKLTIGTISLSTEKDTASVSFKTGESTEKKYTLSLTGFKMLKKMYQPTEVTAEIKFTMADGKSWQSVGRNDVADLFKYKQVSLTAVDSVNNSELGTIGADYYVHEVLPSYKKDSLVAKLKIYSLDKLLTIGKTCNAFTAKKLGADILDKQIPEYKKPYDKSTSLAYSVTNMRVLKYTNASSKSVEHMFPYLVQYNESFYDMLCRTCNRWGEFVYWEDGKLNIGYDSSTKATSLNSGYNTITFPDSNNDLDLIPSSATGNLFPVGADDATIRDDYAKKSKHEVSGKIFSKTDWDKYFVPKFGDFFGMDKFVLNWLFETLVSDIVDFCVDEIAVADDNRIYNKEYFKKDGAADEQYNSGEDEFSEFTEHDTVYSDAKYKKILLQELKALTNFVDIDYGTTWPGLKLGQVIDVNGEQFIVVEVASEVKDDVINFSVKATGTDTDQFYPAILPTGHVRKSGPQKATVQEASEDDPIDRNRVRVVFSWQKTITESSSDSSSSSNSSSSSDSSTTSDSTSSSDSEEVPEYVGDVSPRIRIASSDGGGNKVSRYYEDDEVLIGFVDGNIERPYVIGGVASKGDTDDNDKVFSTPGQHSLKLSDGSGTGLVQLISGAFVPCFNTCNSLFPSSFSNALKLDNMNDWKLNKCFEGGFTLSDRYGIYKISGSTDERSVEIKSPWGEVEMSAFTGITIKAPNGDIKIEGKNVEISAGNNVTITSGKNIKTKLEKEHPVLTFLVDLTAAIADKMAEEFLQLIDLSLVRAVVDAVWRPVEGSLTLKSNRYMKLEAGAKNECSYPTVAYNETKKQKLIEKADQGVANSFSSMGDATIAKGDNIAKGTLKIFKGIKPFTKSLVDNWNKRSSALRDARTAYDKAIDELKKADVAKDTAKSVCSTYDELKDDFWADGEYTEWTEDKLQFNEENVSTQPDNNNKYAPQVNPAALAGKKTDEEKENEAKRICGLRVGKRAAVLTAANNLRKLICEVQNFDVKEADVVAFFKSNQITVFPEDAQEKLLAVACKENCPNSTIFKEYPKTESGVDYRALQVVYPLPATEETYLRRLIIFNLLKEFGIDKDTRRQIKLKPSDTTLTTIDDPDLDSKDTKGKSSLLNDDYWKNFVNSLSGVPILKAKEEETLAGRLVDGLKDTLTGTIGIDYEIVNAIKNEHQWSEGKEGTILLGADEKTYEFKNKIFQEVDTIEPANQIFSEDTTDLKDKAKNNLVKFINALRTELGNN